MKGQKAEITAALVIVAAMIASVVVVMGKAYGSANIVEQTTVGWQPPVIPSCDLEMWDRIRNKCDD